MARRAPFAPAPVLAIGGSASVGKSTAAAALAARSGLPVVHVDDLRRDVLGAGFAAMPDVWRRPVAELVDLLRSETARLAPAITAAVEGLLASGVGGVIEGEGVEPASAAGWPDDVRAVFVVEDDPVRLHETFATRPSRDRYLALDVAERRAVVEMNLRYGAWLRVEAVRHGRPWVSPHPWSTLADRLGRDRRARAVASGVAPVKS